MWILGPRVHSAGQHAEYKTDAAKCGNHPKLHVRAIAKCMEGESCRRRIEMRLTEQQEQINSPQTAQERCTYRRKHFVRRLQSQQKRHILRRCEELEMRPSSARPGGGAAVSTVSTASTTVAPVPPTQVETPPDPCEPPELPRPRHCNPFPWLLPKCGPIGTDRTPVTDASYLPQHFATWHRQSERSPSHASLVTPE